MIAAVYCLPSCTGVMIVLLYCITCLWGLYKVLLQFLAYCIFSSLIIILSTTKPLPPRSISRNVATFSCGFYTQAVVAGGSGNPWVKRFLFSRNDNRKLISFFFYFDRIGVSASSCPSSFVWRWWSYALSVGLLVIQNRLLTSGFRWKKPLAPFLNEMNDPLHVAEQPR